MKKNKVFQFRIDLWGIKPPIWRRIQVPESYTFWDLHVAIQDSMGWYDCHLHQFTIVKPSTGEKYEIGIPEDDDFSMYEGELPGWKQKIAKWFSMNNRKADYVYDFGDDWEHTILLEKILPTEENVRYPICIKGKRACPPEDCGSIPGYEHLCELMKNTAVEEYKEMVEWLGGEYDPEHFDVEEISFDDPKERFKYAFEEDV